MTGPFGDRIGNKLAGALVQGFIYGAAAGPVAETDGQGNVSLRFVYSSDDYMVKSSNGRGSVPLVIHLLDPRIR